VEGVLFCDADSFRESSEDSDCSFDEKPRKSKTSKTKKTSPGKKKAAKPGKTKAKLSRKPPAITTPNRTQAKGKTMFHFVKVPMGLLRRLHYSKLAHIFVL